MNSLCGNRVRCTACFNLLYSSSLRRSVTTCDILLSPTLINLTDNIVILFETKNNNLSTTYKIYRITSKKCDHTITLLTICLNLVQTLSLNSHYLSLFIPFIFQNIISILTSHNNFLITPLYFIQPGSPPPSKTPAKAPIG